MKQAGFVQAVAKGALGQASQGEGRWMTLRRPGGAKRAHDDGAGSGGDDVDAQVCMDFDWRGLLCGGGSGLAALLRDAVPRETDPLREVLFILAKQPGMAAWSGLGCRGTTPSWHGRWRPAWRMLMTAMAAAAAAGRPAGALGQQQPQVVVVPRLRQMTRRLTWQPPLLPA